jgi:hypothetical protein
MVSAPHFFWRAIMNNTEAKENKQINNELEELHNIALQLSYDCYNGKHSQQAISDFLTKISLLKNEVSSKC